MRVIAGTLGGRLFDSPGTQRTHPMSDKARGALFNMLGDIKGLSVLDAFGGTGALSFEAISRGARNVITIDDDKAAQKTIERNIETLGLEEKVELVKAGAGPWMRRHQDAKFDIILCDPPYNDPQFNVLDRLAAHVKPDGIFVLSWPSSVEIPVFPGITQIEQRAHGDLRLIFYRR